jgi:hypothetical protein
MPARRYVCIGVAGQVAGRARKGDYYVQCMTDSRMDRRELKTAEEDVGMAGAVLAGRRQGVENYPDS